MPTAEGIRRFYQKRGIHSTTEDLGVGVAAAVTDIDGAVAVWETTVDPTDLHISELTPKPRAVEAAGSILQRIRKAVKRVRVR